MSRNLTPLQEAIVTRVSHLERMPEGRLRDYLGSYFQGLDEPDDAKALAEVGADAACAAKVPRPPALLPLMSPTAASAPQGGAR